MEQAETVSPDKYENDAPTAWYNHGEYLNGWTYQGLGLGHHMGTDANDLFVAVGYQSAALALMVFVDEEKHGVRTQRREKQELKFETGFEGFWQLNSRLKFEFLGIQQKIENFGLEAGKIIHLSFR